MNPSEDKHLDVCQNIEVGLKHEYEMNPNLTDTMCIFGLENAKIAAKQHFGFAKNESVSSAAEIQGIVNWCVAVAHERVDKINDLTLKDFIARVEKVRRSVQRHSSGGGRSYYEFIRKFVL